MGIGKRSSRGLQHQWTLCIRGGKDPSGAGYCRATAPPGYYRNVKSRAEKWYCFVLEVKINVLHKFRAIVINHYCFRNTFQIKSMLLVFVGTCSFTFLLILKVVAFEIYTCRKDKSRSYLHLISSKEYQSSNVLDINEIYLSKCL